MISFFKEKKKKILVGWTKSGKLILANILSRTNEFEEGKILISKTREIQTKEFKIEVNSKYFENEKIKFEVVDIIGFGNIMLTTKEVLKEVAKTY